MWIAALVAGVGILCVGDSITKAGPTPAPFCGQLGGVNVAVAGTTSDEWANQGTFELMATPALEPDQTVHVLLGANDEAFNIPPNAFRANLLAIVQKASGEGRTVVVTPMWDTGLGTGLIEAYTNVILELAEEGHIRLGPIFYFDPPDSPPGDVHPTQLGHDQLADRLGRHLPVCPGDITGDGAVGVNDLSVVFQNLGLECN